MRHLTVEEIEAGLAHVLAAPRDAGILEMIVRRPALGDREVLEEATLSPEAGLVGDTWAIRPSSSSADGGPHPDKQLTLMNARMTALVAQSRDRWALAGDQLYVDLDLSHEALPPGSRLQIGDAVVELTAAPHRGCKKFLSRFGVDAQRFVASPRGMALRLRGANARVVEAGTIRAGDIVTRIG